MQTTRRLRMTGLMVTGLLLVAMTAGMAAIQVELNGNHVPLSVQPIQVVNRTMVPMRSIFEALGAFVQWNEARQTVTATRGDTILQLTIGELAALVDGQSVPLEVPAMIYRGSTMVPLRFVSEALGADVRWSETAQMVSIFTNDTLPNYQPAALQAVVIPLGTVIPVTLNTALSSATNNVGDAFSVTVRSNEVGDAEFPLGTQIAGVVAGVQRTGGGDPGTLDLSFREARFPDGSETRIDGSLISLDDKSVTRTSTGRLVATVKPTKDNRLMMIGIGAGAGLIIGKLLDQNLIVGGLLGAAAGYFYSELTKDEAKPTDVNVKAGTVFGVRMDGDVTYNASPAYVTARNAFLNLD